MSDSEWIIGIDLCDDYSQLSYYDLQRDEPGSLKVYGETMVPTVIRRGDNGVWFVGTQALEGNEGSLIRPLELGEDRGNVEHISAFIKGMLEGAGITVPDQIHFLTVTFPDDALADLIDRAVTGLVGKDRSMVQSHLLSYEYYVFSQKIELWTRDTGLFEYDSRGLSYTHLFITAGRRPALVRSERDDLSEFLDSSGYDIIEPAERDRRFSEAVRHVSRDRMTGSFYLTGSGFEGVGDGKSWMNLSLAELCAMRRHVFVGQNLFARGACYGSLYAAYPDRRPDFITGDTELTSCELFFMTNSGSRDSALTIVPAQMNFRRAGGRACVIPDDTDIVPVYSRNILTGEINVYDINIKRDERRPNKTLRLMADAMFIKPDRCEVTLRDTGFGELFPPSGFSATMEIDLAGDGDGLRSSEGRLMAAAPFGLPGLEIRLSGKHVYSTDELGWYIFDNVYALSDDFFDERLYAWLDVKTGGNRLSSSLRRMGGRPMSEKLRTMLSAFGYLSPAQISSVCSLVLQLEKMTPLEQTRLKADSLCRYGSYIEALGLYHNATQAMQNASPQPLLDFKAQTWHNMAVCLMHLHDTKCAADCMYRAYKCVNSIDFLSEYICILLMSGRKDEVSLALARENASPDVAEQAQSLYESAARAYEDSERCLGLKAGLALKEMPGRDAYMEFIDGYIAAQCRQYGLYTYKRSGGNYEETVSGTVQQQS